MRGPAYRKFRRKNGIFFAEEIATKKQFSPHTRDRSQADLELRAYNDKALGPAVNRQMRSYRIAWAERAACTGYPERFAMQALGHSSKALHRAYARIANPEVPSLEEYEAGKILPFPASATVPGRSDSPGNSEETSGSIETPSVEAAIRLVRSNPAIAEALLGILTAAGTVKDPAACTG